MKQKWKKLLSCAVAFSVLVSMMPAGGDAQIQVQAADAQETGYEIYPTPRDVTYDGSVLTLTEDVNLVLDDSLDGPTKDRVDVILESKGLKGTKSDGVVSGKTNIVVGVNGKEGAAADWFEKNVTDIEEGFFDKIDAYVLTIKDNVIAILGKDTDAAFYGLSTVKLIFTQLEGNQVRCLRINDYASGQYRGFIEGYYGIPWSVEDRISLMQFGGDFKMNIYIFAPKDDPYHNSNWRELYPKEELDKISKMVAAGTAAKCRFAWAIHPFMNSPITLTNYTESLEIVKKKFEQLYEAGVRQFAISADDANTNAQVQANLCRDMSAWLKTKPGTYNLVFTPQVYCTAAASWGGGYTVKSYFEFFKDLTDVELMWTGEWVCHPASQNTFTNFKNQTGREAFMWLNWPVNDVNHKRLVMGPAGTDILSPGLKDFRGIVTNPLEQAEASKTSLFAIADFAWNTDDFDGEESWSNGFKYIEPGAPEAMHELCKHLTNPSPGGITTMGESVELTPYITAFTNAYSNGAGTGFEESGNALIEQLQKIVVAADDFQANGTNVNLQDEMKPWVDSLRYLSNAVIGYVNTALAVQKGDADAAWNNYIRATRDYQASKNCESPILDTTNGSPTKGQIITQTVEAGAMKIMPLAATLDQTVRGKVMEILDNDFSGSSSSGGGSVDTGEKSVIYSGIGGLYTTDSGSALDHVIDGDDSTYAWFNENASAGAYIGVDLGTTYKLDNIHILQGRTNTDGDIFTDAVLEYSADGQSYETINESCGGNDINEDVLSRNLKARYVRLRTKSGTNKWYSIREFSVTVQAATDYLYTNVESLKETEVTIGRESASISALNNLALKSGEYVGLELPGIFEVTGLTADYTKNSALALEYSTDGFAWRAVPDPFENIDAKYIRIVNKGGVSVSLTLSSLTLTNNKENRTLYSDPAGKEGSEALRAADSSLTTSFVAADGAGSMTWRMLNGLYSDLYILQDPDAISNAQVSVLLEGGVWAKVGKLDKGFNRIQNMTLCGPFSEVRIEWEENGPTIYEAYVKQSDKTLSQILEEVLEAARDMDTSSYGSGNVERLKSAMSKAQDAVSKGASDSEIRDALKALSGAVWGIADVEENPTPGTPTPENPTPENPSPSTPTNPTTPSNPSVGTQIKKGYTTTVKQLQYRVTDAGKKLVAVYGTANKNMKTVKIPASVKIDKASYKVTEISANAFAKMGKLTKVIIGSNVQTIGKKAFANDKKLKTINVNSKVLRKVAKNILSGSNAKGTIKVPKKQKAKYKKLFKKIGKKKIK